MAMFIFAPSFPHTTLRILKCCLSFATARIRQRFAVYFILFSQYLFVAFFARFLRVSYKRTMRVGHCDWTNDHLINLSLRILLKCFEHIFILNFYIFLWTSYSLKKSLHHKTATFVRRQQIYCGFILGVIIGNHLIDSVTPTSVPSCIEKFTVKAIMINVARLLRRTSQSIQITFIAMLIRREWNSRKTRRLVNMTKKIPFGAQFQDHSEVSRDALASLQPKKKKIEIYDVGREKMSWKVIMTSFNIHRRRTQRVRLSRVNFPNTFLIVFWGNLKSDWFEEKIDGRCSKANKLLRAIL